MSSLAFWTVIIILYQTIICVVITWLTLTCRLVPEPAELYEITLMKLLYLYDPEDCGRPFLYNYTGTTEHFIVSTVIWPLDNHVAADFRSKLKILVSFHVVWCFLSIANMVMKDSQFGFYAVLLPFTLSGLATMLLDLVHGTLFLIDAGYTSNEKAIFDYVNENKSYVNPFHDRGINWTDITVTDTSWISISFAYISFKGVVQLIINFWIVKDNYFEGLKNYRRLKYAKHSSKKLTHQNSEHL